MSTPDPVVDGWQLDIAGHRLTRGEVTQRLEPKAMKVLVLLAAQAGVVVSRAALLQAVWGGAFVGDDAVSAAVIKLRRAFEDSARSPRVIETVHKSGYRLIARVAKGEATHQDPVPEQAAGGSLPTVRLATLLRYAFRIESSESSSMGPEEWRRATDAIAADVAEIIQRHGGTSIQESAATIGVFGAPVSQEHHAMRAVQAAIEIRENAAGTTRDGFPFSWQIALASGEILSTSALADLRRTIHGAPLQRVITLGIAALPGEILLAGETQELALGLLGVRRCEPRPHAVGAGDFSRLDEDAGWSRPWEARVERGLTPLFGRDYEVGRLDDLLRGVIDGCGRVVAVSGEPGAGKSRLAHEALLLASGYGFEALIAAASPLEARTPFFPIRGLLMDRLQLSHPLLTDEAVLRSHLEHARPRSPPDVPALLAVLCPERTSDDWNVIDPELRRTRSLAAILDVLLHDERPSLIVFEDLHWADEATLHLIDVIATHIARRPCIVMLTYRPEFIDPWSTKSYYTRLRFDALTPSDSGLMLDHLVGNDPSLQRWKSAVLGQAGGTPLFIEEVVRSTHAIGTLTGEAGELKLADQSSQIHLPASVHTLVADRVGRLSHGAREILSLAAVIGRDIPAALLESLISGALLDRSEDLDELQASELLFESRYQRQPGYVFKHALTQEVAYREIPPSVRRDHHRSVADVLVRSIADGAQVSPGLLARHHSGAEQHELAIEAWVRAADSATRAAAFSDSLDHLRQARSSLTHTTPGDRERLELSIELSAASALVQSAGPTDQAVEDAYRRARVLAASSGTARQQYEAAWGLWFVHLMRGQIGVARQLGDELFELAIGLDDQALQLEAHHVQWSGLSLAGDLAAVRHHAEIGIQHYRPEQHHWLTFSYGGHDPGVCSRNLDAMALWLLGQPDLARERSAAGVSLAEELGHPYTQLESFNSALNIALLDGDADALLRHAGVLQALVDDGALPEVASSYVNGFRANALVLNGDLEAGLALMSTAVPVWQEFWGAWCFPLDSALATTLAMVGNTTDAIALINGRLKLVEESGARWWNPEFHRVLGELLLADDAANADRAAACMQRALAEARRQTSRFLELRAATSLARLYRDRSQRSEALRVLNASCDLFDDDAGMTDLRAARALRDELTRN